MFHKDVTRPHKTHSEPWLHISTEFTKYFRLAISVNLGAKFSNLIQVQWPKCSQF